MPSTNAPKPVLGRLRACDCRFTRSRPGDGAVSKFLGSYYSVSKGKKDRDSVTPLRMSSISIALRKET